MPPNFPWYSLPPLPPIPPPQPSITYNNCTINNDSNYGAHNQQQNITSTSPHLKRLLDENPEEKVPRKKKLFFKKKRKHA